MSIKGMGRSIKITLKGVPPSLNRFAGRENVWEYRDAKNAWTSLVCWAIKAQGCKISKPFERARVVITYYFPDNRRHDADNYCGKLLLDGLTHGGLIVDDDFKHISLTVDGEVDRENPRTEIVVQEA